MKKTVALLLVLILTCAFAGCGGGADSALDSLSLSEIMEKCLDGVADLPSVADIELNADNFSYFAFTDMPEGAEGLASEAQISAVAHSVVLVRVADKSEAETLAAQMEQNADPNKWICVGAEKVIVTQRGNVVLLVMSWTDTAQAIADNFAAIN